MARNRITAGISGMLLTYGIDSIKSGTMHTIGIADHYKIPIFFIKDTIHTNVKKHLENTYHALEVTHPQEITDHFSE